MKPPGRFRGARPSGLRGHRPVVATGMVLFALATAALWWSDRSPPLTNAEQDAATAERGRTTSSDPAAESMATAHAPPTQNPQQASSLPRPAASDPQSDEPQLMARLRALGPGQPALAIDLARQGNERFPDGPGAPERASILVHALASQGRSSEARAEAEEMVNRYPDSDWIREVERFSGAHRHRNIRVNEAGGLEFY